jgi:indole-3-glycerol phosphate synthase
MAGVSFGAASVGQADLLETIVGSAKHSADARQRVLPIDALRRQIVRVPRGDAFHQAVRTSATPRVIAECKRRSPSKGILRPDYDPASHARRYADGGAAAISVLTESTFFDGSLDHLSAVRAVVDVPLLRKDFIVTEYQLVEAVVRGADAVLLIVGALDDQALQTLHQHATELGLAVLVEVHDLDELSRAVDAGAAIIGVNSRNLRTLAVDLSVLDQVVAAMPAGVIAVAESGIRTPADIGRLSSLGYHAFLVGERLITEADPGEALRALRTGSQLSAFSSQQELRDVKTEG